jgi:PTH1 family peptidyl-tRNA hydrolase
MRLIAGLGNPGPAYQGNRHNIGFMALDAIHRRHGFPPWRSRFQGDASEGLIAGERALLLRPRTFMNESGRSVGDAARFLKLPLDHVIVLHDELDLPPARVRVKTGGGNAGNNGLRSITALLGNDYRRVRLGIGHPGDKAAVSNYVLSDFAKSDRAWVEVLCDAVAANAGLLMQGEDARFQAIVQQAMDSAGFAEVLPPRGRAAD